MVHVRELELIQLAAGQLPGERRSAVEEHLAVCAECRGRCEAYRRVAGALGDWEAAPPAADLWPAVRRRIERNDPRSGSRLVMVALRVGRFAAAVVIGLGAGYAGGRTWWPAAPPRIATLAFPAPDGVDAEPEWYLFDSPSPAGLWPTLAGLAQQESPPEGN